MKDAALIMCNYVIAPSNLRQLFIESFCFCPGWEMSSERPYGNYKQLMIRIKAKSNSKKVSQERKAP